MARSAFKAGYELFGQEQYYPAIDSFKIAIIDTSYPLLDYSYFYIAKAYQKKFDFDKAIEVYQIVLKYFPNSVCIPKSLFGVAECQRFSENYEEAARNYRNFIAQFPGHESVPEARFRLGNCLENIGNNEDAARVYRNLDLIHPDSYFAEKALEQLDKLAKQSTLAVYEAPAASIYNLGVKYFKNKNYTKAKEYFTRLTKFYKKSSFYDESLLMLGRVFLRKDQTNLAITYLKKSINQNKDAKPEAMYYLARAHGYLDEQNSAINILEKLAIRYPNSHLADEALYYIGYFQAELENPDKAANAYSRLVLSYPNSSYFDEAVWHTGNMHYKNGDYLAAYEIFRQALKLPAKTSSDRLLYWAGKCAGKIGDQDEAVSIFKTTVKRFEHSYYGYRAREELGKLNVPTKPIGITPVAQIIEKISGETPETVSHQEKYLELLALKMADEAAEEATFIEAKVPMSEKDKVRIAKYHAYIMKGQFSKPIQFADKKIQEAMLSSRLDELDPRLWKFSYPRGYWSYVDKYSKMHDLDPYLVYAVIREESRFKSRALSHSWAHGLMQIIPSTGRIICRKLGISYARWKMYEPRVNIQMGVWYLADLIKRFDGNIELAVAGYNGGPGRVKRWTKKYKELDMDEFIEDIPLRETRNYVKKVMKSYYGYKRTYSGGG